MMQAMIAEANQHSEVRSPHIGTINDRRQLVHAKVDIRSESNLVIKYMISTLSIDLRYQISRVHYFRVMMSRVYSDSSENETRNQHYEEPHF